MEVEKTASLEEMKESYRKLIKKYHPDKGGPKSGLKVQKEKIEYFLIQFNSFKKFKKLIQFYPILKKKKYMTEQE